jgi:hypothetical protein
MKTDELKKLVEAATREPWSVPHFADDDTRCNCKYVLAEYGGMGSIATIGVCKNMDGPWGDDNGPDVEQAKANARLIAAAPALAREVIALREAAVALATTGRSPAQATGSCRRGARWSGNGR